MLPIILVSEIEKDINHFLNSFIEKNKYSAANIFRIYPIKQEILISQIRELRKEILVKVSSPRLFLIYNFDQANLEAQNALLKTLEENNENNNFILILKNFYKVLPTVRSRCKIEKLGTTAKLKNENLEHIRALINKIENNENYGFLSDPKINNLTNDGVHSLMTDLILFFRNRLAVDPKSGKIIRKIIELKSLMLNNNLNPKLTLDNLLIFIAKTSRMKI